MLELDPRIDISKIKTILNADDSLIGKTGYFATNLMAFKDLNLCFSHGAVVNLETDYNGYVFVVKDADGVFRTEKYFIADEDLQPPAVVKYKPFGNIEQFLKTFNLGDTIKFRIKNDSEFIEESLLVSVRCFRKRPTVCIGCNFYNFYELFKNYEWWDEKLGWIPFGVKVYG